MSDTQASEAILRKKLIVCCDGTGQSATSGKPAVPTNVTRFAQALKTSVPPSDDQPEVPQVVLYQTGIGSTEVTWAGATIAQSFGTGIDAHILEAYTFFSHNFEADDELFLFGFSRGAFTARAIATLICNAGLLRKESLGDLPMIYEKYKHRLDKPGAFEDWMRKRRHLFKFHKNVVIRILGLFDTVGSLGVPQTWISSGLDKLGLPHPNWNARHGYHDTSLPAPKQDDDEWRAFIVAGYHALSLDENRTSFAPTLLYVPVKDNDEPLFAGHGSGFIQCWFPGVHTDVGGGYERGYRDISDLSFAWMVDMCSSALVFDENVTAHLKKGSSKSQDPLEVVTKENAPPLANDWGRSVAHDELHTIKFRLGGGETRKPGEYFLGMKNEKGEKLHFKTTETMHPSVRYRMMMGDKNTKTNAVTPYRPPALAGWKLKKVETVYEGTDEASVQWQWEKLVHVKGEKGPTLLVIPEEGWSTNFKVTADGSREKVPTELGSLSAVQDTLLTDDVRCALDDIAKCEKIEMVPEVAGWW